jgi:hypothetical protein
MMSAINWNGRNWEQLPRGRELDRLIAVQRGWKFYEMQQDPYGPPDKVVSLQGKVLLSRGAQFSTWDQVCDHAKVVLPWWHEHATSAIQAIAGLHLDWSLQSDQDYGVDHRAGYSVAIGGVVLAEFEESAEFALWKAYLRQVLSQ